MREIKFRAWDKDEKIMKEVYAINFPLGKSSGKDIIAYNQKKDCDEWICDYELMQYTGLKDTNGKEIYEGDIVICNRNIGSSIDNQMFVVEWKNGYITFEFNNGWDILEISQHGIVEVIGNIYENPNLLG